ncbi:MULTISPECIES: FecR family protein [Niastella]|uniref:FecR domain-containing protein n=1 Tax=Niastella soli TaxID=2821487 RepID=A0ABS3YYK4_9BACT|nr:FecR family protein [Niastella soli]MBO9202813.1 FecR domain-containing protein [Niastella soli]
MKDMANRIAFLIGKHLKQELSDEDSRELHAWMEESVDNREIFEQLTDVEYLEQTIREKYQTKPIASTREKLNRLIEAEDEPVQNIGNIRRLWLRLSVAAAVLIILAGAVMYIYKIDQQAGNGVVKTGNEKQDIAPGINKATLKLADGRSIVLDSSTKGQLPQQGGIQVSNKNGQLIYAAASVNNEGEDLWNTLSTARGQTYPVLLSDGSKAWLNSESSIRFPVFFKGDLREVQITGEVLFEVAHNPSKPFKVTAGEINVQVLGTTFNVNAYKDEDAIRTTLIEGSVQVTKGIQWKKIRPGQQAQVLPDEIKVAEVDVEKVIAWKQGLFRFKEDKLSEAMKNIARWYNVEVVFEGNSANVGLSGTIPRTAHISEVIKALSMLDVAARIEGRKLILNAQ